MAEENKTTTQSDSGPIPADAQIYELIKVCKRKWQTAVACIVIEKGVEKVVEKSAEEWLSWRLRAPRPPRPSRGSRPSGRT